MDEPSASPIVTDLEADSRLRHADQLLEQLANMTDQLAPGALNVIVVSHRGGGAVKPESLSRPVHRRRLAHVACGSGHLRLLPQLAELDWRKLPGEAADRRRDRAPHAEAAVILHL